MSQIELIQGDITQLSVDAIVNAANSSLMSGGGVDGAIHRAAGPELRAFCETLGGCAPGQAKLTPGFGLSSTNHIIHTVGPVWHGGNHAEAELLASCYQSCLRLAVENQFKIIAFPAISCGVYGYPAELASKVAFTQVSLFLEDQSTIERVIFCCFSDEIFELYQQAMNCLSGSY